METSLKLSDQFKLDQDKVALAAIIHDRGKEINHEELLIIAEKAGVITDESERQNPGLLHGPVGAQLLYEEGMIQDQDILKAVRYHTTGRPAMSELEIIIFLADLIEPGRNYPKVDALRQLSCDNPFVALSKSLDWTLEFLMRKTRVIHPLTVKTRNYYLN